jgi:hypothetical protein
VAKCFAAVVSEMQFELSVTHKGVTVTLASADAPNLRQLNEFLNSLTDRAIKEILPEPRKPGRPRKHPVKVKGKRGRPRKVVA